MLPTDPKARKAIPVYSGFVKYFPRAMCAVAELSRIGNDQHNPGQPLHWDRSKSGDEKDALMRHMLDDAMGVPEDTDGVKHATKLAWRAMANLEKVLEAAEKPAEIEPTPAVKRSCITCRWLDGPCAIGERLRCACTEGFPAWEP